MSAFTDFESARQQACLDEDTFYGESAKTHRLPFKPLSQWVIDDHAIAAFDAAACVRHRVIPIYATPSEYCVVVDNPFQPYLSDLERSVSGTQVVGLVTASDMSRYWQASTAQTDTDYHELLDEIMSKALFHQATDVHFSRKSDEMMVSFRIDGGLQPIQTLNRSVADLLVSQIKLRSNLDVSVALLPQDGRLHIGSVDVRVAVIPTVYGEDVVCRLFQRQGGDFTLSSCGFSDEQYETIQQMLANQSGLIVVSGATGSGKTTTVYSMLNEFQGAGKNIVTIEDPVEYVFDHVRQTQVNLVSGYTFSTGLRALLRQDPDIIVVGEIRDEQTAKIALEAAYTGHLVIATIHTQSISSTITRLTQFGLDPVMVRESIRGIISQSLVSRQGVRTLNAEVA